MRRNEMLSQQRHSAPGADARFGVHHCLHAVARDANGQPRTYRLAPSSEQNTAYRRLALAILGLDVATLADKLRSDRKAGSAPVVPTPIATGGLLRLSSTAAIVTRSA
jgi:hypothetical protein